MARTKTNISKDSTANLGFEGKLWLAGEQAVTAPHNALAESRTLAALRDTLLPKLLSGEHKAIN